jgi:hypothetical protein
MSPFNHERRTGTKKNQFRRVFGPKICLKTILSRHKTILSRHDCAETLAVSDLGREVN